MFNMMIDNCVLLLSNISHNRFHGPLPEVPPPKYIVSVYVASSCL